MFRSIVFLGMFYNMYQILILQTLPFSVDSAWKVEVEGSQTVDAFFHFQIGDFFRGGGKNFLVRMPFHVFFPRLCPLGSDAGWTYGLGADLLRDQ